MFRPHLFAFLHCLFCAVELSFPVFDWSEWDVHLFSCHRDRVFTLEYNRSQMREARSVEKQSFKFKGSLLSNLLRLKISWLNMD